MDWGRAVPREFAWTPAPPIIGDDPSSGRLRRLVTEVCFDRAVLVAELPDSLVDAAFPRDDRDGRTAAARLRMAALRVTPTAEQANPARYLPPGAWPDLFIDADLHIDVRLRRHRPRGWSWPELVAAGFPASAHQLAAAIDYVFDEEKAVANLREADPNAPFGHFSFAERCRLAGREDLVPPVQVDRSASDFGRERSWSEGPRRRIAEARKARAATYGDGWRFPGHLQLEATFRLKLRAVSGSARSAAAGIRCWAAFNDAFNPHLAHFLVDDGLLGHFACYFGNAGTLSNYIGHLRLASRLLTPPQPFPPSDQVAGLLRSARKFSTRRPRFFLRREACERLVLKLQERHKTTLARAVIVCRHFLFRAQSELFGLQTDGRSGGGHGAWHSWLVFGSDLRSVRVHLRHRKCHPHGCVVERQCACPHPDDRPRLPPKEAARQRLFCGVCALHAAVREAPHATSRIFEGVESYNALCLLRTLEPDFRWHGIRRGAAADLFTDGHSVGHILQQGDWRSAAFLSYVNRAEVGSRLDRDRRALETSIHLSDSD